MASRLQRLTGFHTEQKSNINPDQDQEQDQDQEPDQDQDQDQKSNTNLLETNPHRQNGPYRSKGQGQDQEHDQEPEQKSNIDLRETHPHRQNGSYRSKGQGQNGSYQTKTAFEILKLAIPPYKRDKLIELLQADGREANSELKMMIFEEVQAGVHKILNLLVASHAIGDDENGMYDILQDTWLMTDKNNPNANKIKTDFTNVVSEVFKKRFFSNPRHAAATKSYYPPAPTVKSQAPAPTVKSQAPASAPTAQNIMGDMIEMLMGMKQANLDQQALMQKMQEELDNRRDR